MYGEVIEILNTHTLNISLMFLHLCFTHVYYLNLPNLLHDGKEQCVPISIFDAEHLHSIFHHSPVARY